mgnify:CR=1 FL=1
MGRCAAELRGNVYGRGRPQWRPVGQEIAIEVSNDKKFKLYKAGKCKKCEYFGFLQSVVNEMREVWGEKWKPKKKDYECLLNTSDWGRLCPRSK